MSESKPKKISVWSFALILLPLMVLLAYTYFSRGGQAGSGGSIDGEFVFDPGPVKELEIKGVLADGASSWDELAVTAAPPLDEKLTARGKELYSKACAACHGEDGKGEGPALSHLKLNSRPANFTLPIASIKIRSTQKGTLPAESDLFRTLTRGIPGTAMLSFRDLPEADRWALVYRIEEFFVSGKKWPASVALEVPKVLPKDDALLAEGMQEFRHWCLNCHGSDGMGNTSFAFQMQNQWPGIAFARGGGKFMLRGSKPDDIVRTLMAGSSGSSPMMSFKPTFYGDEPNAHDLISGDRKLWGTAYYARKLIEDQGK